MMRFNESHEWMQVKGNIGTVGISDFAQKELGEIVYVELPKVGQHLKAGEESVVCEATKAADDVYAPVSGKVIEVKEEVKKDPAMINQGAESKGWLFKIELTRPGELD